MKYKTLNEVRLPELGEGIEKATLAAWFFKEGDTVKDGDDLAEFVTDKASFVVSCNADGILAKILFKEGENVAVGAVLAIIEPSKN